jgi:hypothetical protein
MALTLAAAQEAPDFLDFIAGYVERAAQNDPKAIQLRFSALDKSLEQVSQLIKTIPQTPPERLPEVVARLERESSWTRILLQDVQWRGAAFSHFIAGYATSGARAKAFKQEQGWRQGGAEGGRIKQAKHRMRDEQIRQEYAEASTPKTRAERSQRADKLGRKYHLSRRQIQRIVSKTPVGEKHQKDAATQLPPEP